MVRRIVVAAAVASLVAAFSANSSIAATAVKQRQELVVKKRVMPAKSAVVSKTYVNLKVAGARAAPAAAVKNSCGSFLTCLFGSRRGVSGRVSRSSFGKFQSTGLSNRMTRQIVDWDETKYPVGSLVIRTPERALYLVTADDEAIRYKVGVGRDGFQWSGNSRIVAKREWPSWTPPQEMIEREAEKGVTIPDFMEGGPGNPLGARALYIGGTIFRVHGTNNESSIGGAVSSGCIRMMNADVIDLYTRVKVGSPIYVYQ